MTVWSTFVIETASPVEAECGECGSCPSESAGTNHRPDLQWVRLLSGYQSGTVQSAHPSGELHPLAGDQPPYKPGSTPIKFVVQNETYIFCLLQRYNCSRDNIERESGVIRYKYMFNLSQRLDNNNSCIAMWAVSVIKRKLVDRNIKITRPKDKLYGENNHEIWHSVTDLLELELLATVLTVLSSLSLLVSTTVLSLAAEPWSL